MVAPSPRTRRPPTRPQPRPLPPSAGRRPPPYSYGPPPRHGGRRLLVLVLVLATLGAVGYLYLSNRGSGGGATATGYLGANQASVKAVGGVLTAGATVQRFAELHNFDGIAVMEVQNLQVQLQKVQQAESGASGRQKQIASDSANTLQQAIDAVGQYRKAVAFTYRLIDADTARQELANVVVSLNQQAQQWQHA